ncbi:MAG: SEC-C domain-containing protein [Bacteroidia bacterium]|nr:SEC-C domain-containing protein [Bacteroidia bacterium]
MSPEEWKKDVQQAVDAYPGLIYSEFNGERHLKGSIKVEDVDSGIVVDEFEVDLVFPENYPYCFPKVFEISGKIERIDDRHVFPADGSLCLGVEPEEILRCKHGITIRYFIDRVLIPRLAEEFIVNNGGDYQREYAHGIYGLWQFYMKMFESKDRQTILKLLRCMGDQSLPRGHKPCPCGSGKKFKRCHFKNILQFVNNFDSNYLRKQYELLSSSLFKRAQASLT